MTTNATIDDAAESADTDVETRPRPSYDDVNVPVIFLIGIISAVVTLLTIWVVEGLYYHWRADLIRERNYDVVNWRQVEEINAQKEQVTEGDAELGYESLVSVVPDVLDKFQTETGSSGSGEAEDHENH